MQTKSIDPRTIDLDTRLAIPRYLAIEVTKQADTFEVEFGFTPSTKTRVSFDSEGLEVLKAFRTPQSPRDVAGLLATDPQKLLAGCRDLARVRVLGEVVPSESIGRYDRHGLFFALAGACPIETQARIRRSKVALIGMGGVGNWVATALIGSGLEELRLIDFDVIEVSNLTRQILFVERDVGSPKVVKAAERLVQMNSETRVVAHDLEVRESTDLTALLSGIDFVVLSADHPSSIHDWTDSACKALGIPYLNVGYSDGVGVVGPMTIHGATNCYACHKHDEARSNSHESNEAPVFRYQAPSFGPLNALVSAIAANEVLKHLGGFGEVASLGRQVRIDPLTLDLEFVDFDIDPECRSCKSLQADVS